VSVDNKIFPAPGFETTKGTRIECVNTEALAQALYSFRYHIYVEKMNRNQEYADHKDGIIFEPLDRSGTNFVSIRDGIITGCIRRNLVSDKNALYYKDFYQTDLFNNPEDKIGFTTKLMVLPEYQNTSLPVRLISSYAAEGYKNGIQIDLIDCNDHLIKFFERMGYFTHTGWKIHKEYGNVLPMFFAVETVNYLTEIRSFLGPVAKRYVKDNQYGGYDTISRLAFEPEDKKISDISSQYRLKK